MTVAHRSTATVTNATAGTSVTVSKPAATADGDVLLAFIAELGTGAITKPAGWTLIGTVAGGTGVTLGAYWKVAASEGASWTWTLGASVRNWGAVHAMTGVDTSDPVASSASDGDTGGTISGLGNDPVDDLPRLGYLLTGLAGAATATGSATTWSILTAQTEWDTDVVELADVGTNGGAGTDITGTVLGFAAPERIVPRSGWMFASLCSQNQSSGAGWSVALNPAGATTAYDGTIPTGMIVKAAFGADPNGDPDGWTWTDITSAVRFREGMRITKGRSDWASSAQPTRVQFAVNNPSGDWTPEHPTGGHYPNIAVDLPIQIIMPYGASGESRRATVFVDGYRPQWDPSANWSIVNISASGRLRRINKNQQAVNSPLFQSLSGIAPGDYVPHAYWPCEDGTNATQFASAITGAQPGKPSRSIAFASDSDLLSSAPLPVMSSGATATFLVPSYTDTNQWTVYLVLNVPSEPATETPLVEIRSTGTARRFVYAVAPGSPATLILRMYDSSGTQISFGTTTLGVNGIPDESSFFGSWVLHVIALADDGFGANPTGYSSLTKTTHFSGLGGTSAGASYGVIQQIKVFAGDGNAFGHVVVFTDSAFDVFGDGLDTAAEAFTAYVGETTLTRFARLCTERGIDYDYTWQAFTRDGIELALNAETHTPMGAQPRTSLSGQFREIESTEATLIHDGGPDGELILDVLRDRYNRDVDLTVDMDLAQLALGFEPVFDDQRLVDDVTATNRDGSSYRYAATNSGEHTGRADVNVSPEEWLAYVAGWQVNLGTAAGFRYPTLSINLRRSPELANAWLACQIGSRVQAVNLMSQHPSTTTADVIIEGYTETISTDRWTVDLNVAPYQPYQVFEVEGDDNQGRADTAGCVLAEAVNSSATSLKLATTSGPLWINSTDRPQDFPFDVRISGQRNTITAIAKPSITFVSAGTASTGSSGSRTPGLPGSLQSGDLVLIFASTRNSGAGTPDTPANWQRYPLFEAASCAQVFGRIYDGVWTMPTVTYTGGAANEDTIAQSAAFRSTFYNAANLAVAHASCLNPSAQNITAAGVPAGGLPEELVALYCGWKADDWTSVATPGSWTEIQEATSTAGNDAGQVWGYRLFTARPAAGSLQPAITVTGGASAISRGGVLVIRPNYQTATATRGTDGVTKALAAADAVSLWNPAVIAL